MDTMYAVRGHARGGPEQLLYETALRPQPAKGEVLIAVHAAAITSGELGWDATWTDRFDGSGQDRTPIVPAHEVSGTIAGLGDEVRSLRVGDEVCGLLPFDRDGAAAEYVTAPAGLLAPKPATLDHVHAAALVLPGLVAWQALCDTAGVSAGQHVLIHGGAGGIGPLAVQLAAALGAKVAATVAARDREFVAELGASTVIDYQNERFEDRLSGLDAVIDLVGGETQVRSWPVLRPGGVVVGVAAPPSPELAEQHGARGAFFVVEPRAHELATLGRLADEGRLHPVVDRTLPLHETRAAYETLLSEHPRGKVVITVPR